MLMSEAIEKYAASLRRLGRSEKTISWYEMHLRNFDRGRLLHDLELVTLDDLRTHIDGLLRRKLKPATVRGAAMSLKVFLRWCVVEQILKDNPADRLELIKIPERVPEALEESEILTLLNAAARSPTPERDQALISFLTETGARLNEVVTLTVEHVDLDSGVAIVLGKGSRQEFVFFEAATRKVLSMWLRVRPVQYRCLKCLSKSLEPGVCPVDKETRQATVFNLSQWGITQVFKRLSLATGIKVHPHLFRHTSATLRAENGAQDMDLQAFYRWKSSSMSRVYVVKARLHSRAKLSSPMDGVMRNQLIDTQLVFEKPTDS